MAYAGDVCLQALVARDSPTELQCFGRHAFQKADVMDLVESERATPIVLVAFEFSVLYREQLQRHSRQVIAGQISVLV